MPALAKKERLELRLSADSKASIETAASLRRVTVSQFVAESAIERAETVIQENSRIKLTEESWNKVMHAIDSMPAPNERFQRAVERMDEESTWKWNDN